LRYEDYKVPEDTFYYQDTYFPLFGNRLKNTAGEETHAAMMLGKAGQWGYSYTTLSSYDQRVGLFTGAIGRVTTDRLLPDGSNNIDLSFQRVQHYKLINNS
jgi:iron complex outermembrane receptor protein